MGASKSAQIIDERSLISDEDIAALMMPIYYVSDSTVAEVDISNAKLCWKIIANGSSPVYKAYKDSTGPPALESLQWFSQLFYQRLFDVNPSARPLFKNSIEVQGRVLIAIISTALSQLKDPVGFNGTLVNLAHVHVTRGVRATQFGLMGDILFWTLRTTLGEIFTDEYRLSWVRIYSRMLKIILPTMIGDERRALATGKDSTTHDKPPNK